MEAFSLRLPEQWTGRFNSAQVQRWLAEFLQRPCPLPPDPGPGSLQVSLSLPTPAVCALSDSLGDPSAAVALRRLVALNLGFLSDGQEAPHEARLPALEGDRSGIVSGRAPEPPDEIEPVSELVWSSFELPPEAVLQAEPPSIAPPGVGWSGLPFEAWATLIIGAIVVVLIILSWRKRTAIPAALPNPAFMPWTPLI
jgi:hypothetical protein